MSYINNNFSGLTPTDHQEIEYLMVTYRLSEERAFEVWEKELEPYYEEDIPGYSMKLSQEEMLFIENKAINTHQVEENDMSFMDLVKFLAIA
ncbi:MAG: hypothetical protein RSA79_00120 [Oscillospiraceae bacterium]